MEELETIRTLINQGDADTAIALLEELIQKDTPHKDEAYYLLGNAWRKKGDWQKAINNYLSAIELNPGSPAVQAHQMLLDILNFYNKDMYNQ